MSQFNRRNALAAAVATLPAIAVLPATALAVADDAELLRLGALLDPIAAEWAAQRVIDERERAPFEAEVEAITGIARKDAPSIYDDVEYWRARCLLSKGWDYGDGDDDGVWDRLFDRMYPLVEKILSLKAQTVRGLAVQARAIALADCELWESDKLHREEARCRLFIESVCAFAGIAPLPGGLVAAPIVIYLD
jgi:hypothetical protein